MTVEISWKPEHDENGDNHAEFWVGTRPDFGGKRWRAKIPTTGSYYIYVMAHPSAEYTLKVTVK